MEDEWISVKDRLPEEIHTIAYLVSDGRDIEIAKWDMALWNNENGQEWDWLYHGRRNSLKVKYWMPLPRVPQKKRLRKVKKPE